LLVLLVGVGVSVFSEHYRGVLENMLAITTALLAPLFFIILAMIFFTGPKVLNFPGLKNALYVMAVIIIIGGVTATLGNDIANQISGSSIRATDSLFKTDFLNASFFLIISLSVFSAILIKK
jgi:hypothetical protein